MHARSCGGRPCYDKGDGGISLGDNAHYEAAFAPGVGLRLNFFGLKITALDVNAAEGIKGNFSGDYNPFLEGNLTLIKVQAGKHAIGLGASTHATLRGNGNSKFVADYTFGYSRGGVSTSGSSVGITVNPVLLKGGVSFDFGPYLFPSGNGISTGGQSGRRRDW